jgi:hypothetical protein
VLRHADETGAIPVVEPVDAEEVQWVRLVRPDGRQRVRDPIGDQRGVGELSEGRQPDRGDAATLDCALEGMGVDRFLSVLELTGRQSSLRSGCFIRR